MDRHPLSYLRTGAIGSAIFAVAWALVGVANFLENAVITKWTESWFPALECVNESAGLALVGSVGKIFLAPGLVGPSVWRRRRQLRCTLWPNFVKTRGYG
jgi:hypothetical protein